MNGNAAAVCAICGKTVIERFKPFCSSRCAQIDLGRWLGEGYRVPSVEEPDEDSIHDDVKVNRQD